MKKISWKKLISLLVSFAIMFNITVVPAFAEGEDVAEEPAQEETAEEPQAESDEAEEPAAEEEKPEEAEPEEGPAEEEKSPGEEEEPAAEEEKSEKAEPEEHVGGEGKYVSDVYIAYAKTEEEARKWLRKNGWEPLTGNADFNAGKASFFDDNKLQDQNVAAVMGIKRTDDAKKAVTDMAIMNMKGGYSFPDYEALLKEKKKDIDEFIDTFIPVLEEYRKNYDGKGSAVGQKRAELAHDLLNRFYDGGEEEPYAANDTGKPLGDLFLEKVMQEGNKEGGDLEQIILESSGASVTTIETCLALAADAEKTSWIERLEGLSGDELQKNLGKYVPEAEGQDIAPSAVKQFLKQHFGDQAKILADQWDTIHDKLVWFEEYNDRNGLWKHDGESVASYQKRLNKYIDALIKEKGELTPELEEYVRTLSLYEDLYVITYEGEWGETLGDFFNPAEDSGYASDVTDFLPIAAALSEGQRSAAELISLETLLLLGMGTEDSVSELFKDIDSVFGDAETISIYSGINRGIFRGGVALTSAALMEKNQSGADPFADMWSFSGIYNITTYAAAISGIVLMGIGRGFLASVPGKMSNLTNERTQVEILKNKYVASYDEDMKVINRVQNELQGDWSKTNYDQELVEMDMRVSYDEMNKNVAKLEKIDHDIKNIKTGRVLMGIGGALLVGAAVAKGYQLYRYYQKTFTQIPMYIVDEADIVSYDEDDEGNEIKLISFDQYVYYEAVKCNRQEVGEIGDWQDGVSDYAAWGCGDAADLNADMGQQWLALYQVKSDRKGYPVLADTLSLSYGSKAMPEGCSKALHMFTYESAADIGDTAYAFNNGKKGIYFFWGVDEEAYAEEAASAFAGGTAAVSGGIGLLVGILGTAIVMRKKRKEA